ncbi:HAMP domain-containing sensor histidine kinase [Streptomyces sp. OP7]|uniref:sensor histidine kinase n=1 Tax=Streptomyces sp. OP7 TaxID=3142462 RepID=UPI0032E8B6F8
MRWWPRRPRPRSLRGRLVLIACLLATGAVLVCQLAGLTVLRGWLTDQVDERLSHFRPPDGPSAGRADDGRPAPPPPPPPRTALPSDFRVFFYDDEGVLLPTSLGSGNGAGPRLPREAADLALTDGRPATVPADGDGADSGWRVLAHSGPGGTRAVVALPLDTVDGATAKLLWLSLGLGVTVAVGVVALGNGAIRLGLRPLTRVEHTAQRITGGALEASVPVADPDTEVGRLGLALNTMLDRLRTALHRTETSETRLRHFMADAGHELRTPLTAVRGFADLLLHEPDMPADRRREAHALIARNAERMSRLVDDLFLLARLGDSPVAHREPVDLLSLTADAIATTAIRHPDRSITLEPLESSEVLESLEPPELLKPLESLEPSESLEPPEPRASAQAPAAGPGTGRDLDVVETPGDPHQLAQVLGNLLTNACTHTPSDSRVRVRVGAARSGAAGALGSGPPLPPGTPVCVVEVADDGPGIRPDEAPHVFDRFYRATPPPRTSPSVTAQPQDAAVEPGSGLGLAIAAAIATAHGGRLELENRPDEGCVFRLLLPDATPAPDDGPGEPGPGQAAGPVTRSPFSS